MTEQPTTVQPTTEQPTTEQPTTAQPTTAQPTTDQAERLARLMSRAARTEPAPEAGATTGPATTARSSRRRRRHAAQGSRIAAAGLGATAMLGIVTVFGLDNPFANAEAASAGPGSDATPDTSASAVDASTIEGVIEAARPAVPTAPPIRVVIHRVPAPIDATARDATAGDSAAGDTAAEAPPLPVAAAPIELTAEPVVRTVTVEAPAAPRSNSDTSSAAPAPAPAPATSKGSG